MTEKRRSLDIRHRRAVLLAWAIMLAAGRASAMDHVTFHRHDRQIQVTGKVLVEAEDGGHLVLARDGVIWAVQPEEFVELRPDDKPFTGLSADEMAARLRQEMGPAFKVHQTLHYLVCYNTSAAYAEWCGALLERLHRAFTNDWRNKGFAIQSPSFPLVALVFADRQSYAKHARAELGDAVGSIIGYYSLRTNRVTMVDLTGTNRVGTGRTGRTAAAINQLLARPQALRTVATVVHEATHQIAFNCGLQRRFADIPLWVSEGIAVYYETPDLKSKRSWRKIGAVNYARLNRFRGYLKHRSADSLKTLIQDDLRFRDAGQAEDAYAEAWALNYFLLRKHQDSYVRYLKGLAAKQPLMHDAPAVRIREFQAAFGEDWANLEAKFLRYIRRIR